MQKENCITRWHETYPGNFTALYYYYFLFIFDCSQQASILNTEPITKIIFVQQNDRHQTSHPSKKETNWAAPFEANGCSRVKQPPNDKEWNQTSVDILCTVEEPTREVDGNLSVRQTWLLKWSIHLYHPLAYHKIDNLIIDEIFHQKCVRTADNYHA